MKMHKRALIDLAYQIISNGTDFGLDDDISSANPSIVNIEKCELALFFMRCVAEGKKRIQIDILHGVPVDEKE